MQARRAPRKKKSVETWEPAAPPPVGPTAAAYRIAGYTDGLVGATPECDLLRPHWDSGLRWPDPNNPQPGDWRWGAGVAGGVTWDGAFWRDTARYPAGGQLFWSAYLKAGTAPGSGNGFWLNFGSGWSHLHNDDPAQMLTGAAPRLFYDDGGFVAAVSDRRIINDDRRSETAATVVGQWKLVVEATMFVTNEVVQVWVGVKTGGNDPCGVYTRVDGLDPLPTLTVEAAT